MTIHITCDGCGTNDGEMTERGFVTKAHYCPKCIAVHDAYCIARDELHDEVARHWTEGLSTLDDAYSDDLNVIADRA